MVIDTKKYLDKNDKNEREFADGMNFAEKKLAEFLEIARGVGDDPVEFTKTMIQSCKTVFIDDMPFDSRARTEAYYEGMTATFTLWLEGQN